MRLTKKGSLVFSGFLLLGLGSVNATLKTNFQLKKVIVINETGVGGYAHTTQINFTSNFISNYLAPKYGFTVKTPPNQGLYAQYLTMFPSSAIITSTNYYHFDV